MSKTPSRDEVLRFLSNSASYGNLGLFIGAGFSKAVLNDEFDQIALSWGELLKRVTKKMKVDAKAIKKVGLSYPELASEICKADSDNKNRAYRDSLSQLKQEISALTAWYPDREKRERFSVYLESFSPSWIITTNYDLVIESLLTGKSLPLGPNDPLSAPKGIIPVFHLHGIRTKPDDIIIAQEDYIALFRPTEYRQIKLALTIKESTTLFVGYGLGDVNVLTALDWSRNVFKGEEANYPNGVIQVLRKRKPSEYPYRDKNGIVIVETENLSDFFDDFKMVRARLIRTEAQQQKRLARLAGKLDDPANSMIKRFIDDSIFRKKMLRLLSKFSTNLISGFVFFLDKCIAETWVRSKPRGEFEGYRQNLEIIIDILTAFPVEQIPPALFQAAAYGLQRVEYYIGEGMGQSWRAKQTWDKRKAELDPRTVKELNEFAEQHGYLHLKRLVSL